MGEGGYRGRYAPSPTGDLHLGNLLAALAAAARARQGRGQLLLRMEDLDEPRNVEGAAERIVEDLDGLGLNFDAGPHRDDGFGPYVQSQCGPRYTGALEKLRQSGRLYACTCTRKDLRQMASAPHGGDEGPAYPGICRQKNLPFDDPDLPVAWRFLASKGEITFEDELAGPYAQNVAQAVGDFVVRRKDGQVAYQLAVVVDDAHQQVTEVVRGRDLLSSTPRQIQIYRALGHTPPRFAHLPLWLEADGTRMAKRRGAKTLHALRTQGLSPELILGKVGAALGICAPGDSRSLDALLSAMTPEVLATPSVSDLGPLLP
jgi:glutamyl-tRNA synthetase